MKEGTLNAKLLKCFFAFTLVMGLCVPAIGSSAYGTSDNDVVFTELNDVMQENGQQSDGQGGQDGQDEGDDNGAGMPDGVQGGEDGQGDAGEGNAAGEPADDQGNGDGDVTLLPPANNALQPDGLNAPGEEEVTAEDGIAPLSDEGIAPLAAAGAFTVTGGTAGTDYSYASGVLTILTSTPLTIANTDFGAETADRIVVAGGVQADITLAGINIRTTTGAGILVTNAANTRAHITLKDGTQNIIMLPSGDHAGIECEGNAVLVIDDEVRNTTEPNGNVKNLDNQVVPKDGRIGQTVTLSNGAVLEEGSSLSGLSSSNPGELDVVGGPGAAGIGGAKGTAANRTAGLMVFNGGVIYVSAWGGATATPNVTELKSKAFTDNNTAANNGSTSAGTGIGGGDYNGASTIYFNNAEIYAHGSYHGAGYR